MSSLIERNIMVLLIIRSRTSLTRNQNSAEIFSRNSSEYSLGLKNQRALTTKMTTAARKNDINRHS